MKRINVITLGCAKNIVDSEHLLGQFKDAGWTVEHNSPELGAEVVVINTCGFILDAKEESIETILGYAQAKQTGQLEQLYVMGCLSERYREELRDEIEQVDEFFGVHDMSDLLNRLIEGREYKRSRWQTTPKHYAYLKISEGCNWGCGYCAIPLIRGKHISVPMEDLILEAETLASGGVKELLVIAQDTTYYGMDIYGERKLGELLRKLCKIEGLEWIRLHYAYPTHFPEDVIEAMRDEPKICKYLDIPFQHISDSVLRGMRRGLTKQDTYELIEKLRREVPDIALRTTLLVGYPNESESDFRELEEFVQKVRFERLGVFPYSEEEGTFSATTMQDNVPQEVKEQRAQEIMMIQQEISRELNESLIGKEVRVLIDRHEGEYSVGRTEYDSPEVDNELLIWGELQIGEFYRVRVVSAEDYELFAELV